MEKNNLDKMFIETFDGFSEIPDEGVWERIEASLDKKKKKRIIPLWWQLGGAAAAIALLLYFINPFSTENEITVPTIVDTEKKMNERKSEPIKEGVLDNHSQKKSSSSQVAIEDAESLEEEQEGSKDKVESTRKVDGLEPVTPKRQQKFLRNQTKLAENDTSPKGNEKITTNDKSNTKISPQTLLLEEETKVAEVESNKKVMPSDTEPILNKEGKIDSTKETEVAMAQNEEKEDKKSIYEAIAEKEAFQEEALVDNDKTERWSMGPSIAPVFFSAIGEGSPIHSNFASSTKSGNLNLSYGVTVAYNISKKLSVRSGVHRVDYGYDTNDIVFTSSLTTSTNQLIDNITYAQTSRNLVVQNKEGFSPAPNEGSAVVAQAQPLEGRMVQQLGYVEVPMELNYALFDNKFGINIIGGFSSLFLVDNAVSLESEQLITEMGEANNANSINFSTNIGLGMNYQISQKLQLNVEPIFKYQLNTFSEAAGNFRPYSVGVYSGLNFKF